MRALRAFVVPWLGGGVSHSAPRKKADGYNDPSHNYRDYWSGRRYEHAAEELAIRRLLRGRRAGRAVDVGGGYGRLSVVLAEFADKVTLAEPSEQQLDLAADFLKDHPGIDRRLAQADDLPFADGSVDVLIMVRVMHHLPDPRREFEQIVRVLADDGIVVLEMANYLHARNRIRHLVRRTPISAEPVDIRSPHNRAADSIPFVNHNPHTVFRQLADAGLSVEETLSVSNLRSQQLKKLLPLPAMLAAERVAQRPLARLHFGPSIFIRARKV